MRCRLLSYSCTSAELINIAQAEKAAVLIHDGLDRYTDGIRLGTNRRRAALDAKEWVELLDALCWNDCW